MRRKWTIEEWWFYCRRMGRVRPAAGKAAVSPKEMISGRRGQFKVTFTAGRGGIGPGGHVAFEISGIGQATLCNEKALKSGVGMTVKSSRKNVQLDAVSSTKYGIVDVEVKKGSLKNGDRVTLIFGERSYFSLIYPSNALTFPVNTFVKKDRKSDYRPISSMPSFRIRGGIPVSFRLYASPIVKPGKRFDMSLVVLDEAAKTAREFSPSGNPVEDYAGRPQLSCSSKRSRCSSMVTITQNMKGRVRVGKVSVSRDDYSFFTAVDKERGLIGRSNPISTKPLKDNLKIYFGGIHCHTNFSEHFGTFDFAYDWAKTVALLDFAAVTNHVESLKRTFFRKEQWEATKRAAGKWNQPGRFVTLLGYEWGQWEGEGDRNIYFRDLKGDFLPGVVPDWRNPTNKTRWRWAVLEELWDFYKGRKCIEIPHHPNWGMGANWEKFPPPNISRLVEIHQGRKNGEFGGRNSVTYALKKGHRLGFVGGTDNHFGRPSYGEGLTAVLAKKLTREAVYDALERRQCYATTGAKIIAFMTINGHLMGEEFETGDKLSLTGHAIGADYIEKIEIVRNGRTIKTIQGRKYMSEFSIKDNPKANAYYYMRVTQEDGQMAWTSPIWVNRK